MTTSLEWMDHHRTSNNEWADRHRQALTTRHSHEDVLNDREFELLLEACGELPAPQGFQARLICLLAGRLGLRAGEISHLQTAWLDWNRKLIQIPKHAPCTCGYCKRQARQEASHTDDLSEADAVVARWHPKTVSSARSLPFDLSLRIELCLERFADRYDEFPRSRSTINRRVQAAAEEAGLSGRVYPHCLRETAASHHAYKGVAPVPLQALMGWSDLATAQKYIRISGTATADALRRVHHR
jgi:integrase